MSHTILHALFLLTLMYLFYSLLFNTSINSSIFLLLFSKLYLVDLLLFNTLIYFWSYTNKPNNDTLTYANRRSTTRKASLFNAFLAINNFTSSYSLHSSYTWISSLYFFHFHFIILLIMRIIQSINILLSLFECFIHYNIN